MPELPDSTLLSLHAAVTWALVGLVWTVQLVHYPLFARVGAGGFVRYHADHTRRITWIVAPLMVGEAVLATWLLAQAPPALPDWLTIVGATLVALVWASTATIQVPLHARLADGFDPAAHRRLVRTNGLRTAAWSLRGLLATWMLLHAA